MRQTATVERTLPGPLNPHRPANGGRGVLKHVPVQGMGGNFAVITDRGHQRWQVVHAFQVEDACPAGG